MVTKKSGTKQASKKGGAKKAGKLTLKKQTITNLPLKGKSKKSGKKVMCGCCGSLPSSDGPGPTC
jgi:hypothetical protein